MANYLYQKLENTFEEVERPDIPKSISDNLKFTLRDYQTEALQNFIFYNEFSKKYKDVENKHLLFHMATGSGKTQIIASSILYLYEQGYRNFIFFVNTTNIITKTKANMVKQSETASKYLFKDSIRVNGKIVQINVIEDSFDKAKANNINIMFSTIHALHADLFNQKENRNTIESIKKHPAVLIADEAHHINAGNKKTKTALEDERTWTDTINQLHKANEKNILLEFTATAGYESNAELNKHYKDKVIYDFSFEKFDKAGFSKEVNLIHSDFDDGFRIVQALMLSEYRAMLAEHPDINQVIKPVVMFKNPRGIKAVDASLEMFIELVDDLSIDDLSYVFEYSKVPAVMALREYIKGKEELFVSRIKRGFAKENCVKIYSTSKDKEETLNQLNSLENPSNHIRAVFAVNVLNEGWDVQNLYDIVKLDETKKDNKSTTSDAQLIGRGARYYPFNYVPTLSDTEMRFKRKFDSEPSNSLRVLEKMYFHSVNNSEYIEKLRISMEKQGIKESKKYELKVKPSFLKSETYRQGVVYTNTKEEVPQTDKTLKHYDNNWQHFDVKIDNDSNVFKLSEKQTEKFKPNDPISLADINTIAIRSILNHIPQFHFAQLKDYLPALKSIDEFITNKKYMASMKITIWTTQPIVDGEGNWDEHILYKALYERMQSLANAFLSKSKYEGQKEFLAHRIIEKVAKSKEVSQQDSHVEIDIDEDWYAFEKHYGTSAELEFVEFIQSNIIKPLQKKFTDVKLMRNELVFKIFDFKEGRGFAPDFIFILTKDMCTYQVFCEPKGEYIKDGDKWKEDFMKMINDCTNDETLTLKNEDGVLDYTTGCYKIFGTKFYIQGQSKVFEDSLNEVLEFNV
jgi:type III restriction enzyme